MDYYFGDFEIHHHGFHCRRERGSVCLHSEGMTVNLYFEKTVTLEQGDIEITMDGVDICSSKALQTDKPIYMKGDTAIDSCGQPN